MACNKLLAFSFGFSILYNFRFSRAFSSSINILTGLALVGLRCLSRAGMLRLILLGYFANLFIAFASTISTSLLTNGVFLDSFVMLCLLFLGSSGF